MNASPLGPLGVYEGSGLCVLVDGLARALTTLGHRLTVFVRRDDVSLPARISVTPNMQIAVLDAGLPEPAPEGKLGDCVGEFAARLQAAWADDRPETIHAFGVFAGLATLAAARADGLPFVQTFGHLTSRERRRDDGSEHHISLVRGAARIVATSSSHVFALLGLGASPATIKFVPCGVDLALFTPLPRAQRAGVEPVRVATLGSLGPHNGVGDVIEALALVRGVDLAVGGGAYPEAGILADADALRLQALAQARGVAGRVRFCGHVKRNDVAAFLRSADIVVCPPSGDSMGTVALEAMACGVPLIVSSVGGLVDVVADGMTGIHVPPCAPRQLAYAIEALAADPARRERFGRFGVERTTARYGWARIASEMLDIYRSVTAKSSRLTQSRA